MTLNYWQRLEYRAGSVLKLGHRSARSSRGILSVTFDDFPRSSWLAGGDLLGEVAGRATYYLSGTFHGQEVEGVPYFTAEDVTGLVEAGHELGCHSFDHRSVLDVGLNAYTRSVQRNAEFVRSLLPHYRLRTHAFPFGHVRIANRIALRRRFEVLRGINVPRFLDRFDPSHVDAGGLEERRAGQIDWPRLIAQTAETRGWLVLFTHGVTNQPSPYDTRPDALRSILLRARAEGLEILPVGDALDRMRAAPGLRKDERGSA
jgi:peptidoglycan/xylan/chitin deacetylase (PgdA/CDA1 family)